MKFILSSSSTSRINKNYLANVIINAWDCEKKVEAWELSLEKIIMEELGLESYTLQNSSTSRKKGCIATTASNEKTQFFKVRDHVWILFHKLILTHRRTSLPVH